MQQLIHNKNIIILGKPYEVIIQLKQLKMQFTKLEELLLNNPLKTID